jgi:hypothetical protein
MLAAGGEHVSDLDILRVSPGAFGQLPSNATVSRFFERTVTNPELFGYGIETLTRQLRSRAWEAAGDRNPALSATAADPLIIDLDATLVTSHSDKENVAGTYKGGYGFAPFIASCDYGAGNGTGEILACLLRPGNAGANSADDHIRVFETAVSGLPEGFFDETGTLAGEKVLVRTESAGASRKFLWYLHGQNAQFSVSYPVPAAKAHMVDWVNDKKNWQPALDQGGHLTHRCLGHQRHRHHPAHRLPAGHEPVPARRAPAPRRATDTAGHRRAPDHRVPDKLSALARPVPGRPPPRPRPVREPDQDPEKHRPGQTAFLRLRREPGLGKHRSPGLQPSLLAPAHRTTRRAPRQGMGHQTLALPALRHCRQDHHPRPKELSPPARDGTRTPADPQIARSHREHRGEP